MHARSIPCFPTLQHFVGANGDYTGSPLLNYYNHRTVPHIGDGGKIGFGLMGIV